MIKYIWFFIPLIFLHFLFAAPEAADILRNMFSAYYSQFLCTYLQYSLVKQCSKYKFIHNKYIAAIGNFRVKNDTLKFCKNEAVSYGIEIKNYY